MLTDFERYSNKQPFDIRTNADRSSAKAYFLDCYLKMDPPVLGKEACFSMPATRQPMSPTHIFCHASIIV